LRRALQGCVVAPWDGIGTIKPLLAGLAIPNLRRMAKRVITSVLWLFAAWYAWNVLAWAVGLPTIVGPLIGLAVGLFVGLDPLHAIWRRRPETSSDAPSPAAAAPADKELALRSAPEAR
jgi:hypothetical protein